MKKIILLFCLIMILAGCQQGVVCNKPYILVGTSCCLDQNNNKMCDSDETSLPSQKITTQAPPATPQPMPVTSQPKECVMMLGNKAAGIGSLCENTQQCLDFTKYSMLVSPSIASAVSINCVATSFQKTSDNNGHITCNSVNDCYSKTFIGDMLTNNNAEAPSGGWSGITINALKQMTRCENGFCEITAGMLQSYNVILGAGSEMQYRTP